LLSRLYVLKKKHVLSNFIMVHHVARACKALQHALNSLKRRFSHKMMDPDKKYVHLGAVQQPECPGNHIR
jgi:hypothetical protein